MRRRADEQVSNHRFIGFVFLLITICSKGITLIKNQRKNGFDNIASPERGMQ